MRSFKTSLIGTHRLPISSSTAHSVCLHLVIIPSLFNAFRNARKYSLPSMARGTAAILLLPLVPSLTRFYIEHCQGPPAGWDTHWSHSLPCFKYYALKTRLGFLTCLKFSFSVLLCYEAITPSQGAGDQNLSIKSCNRELKNYPTFH